VHRSQSREVIPQLPFLEEKKRGQRFSQGSSGANAGGGEKRPRCFKALKATQGEKREPEAGEKKKKKFPLRVESPFPQPNPLSGVEGVREKKERPPPIRGNKFQVKKWKRRQLFFGFLGAGMS